MKKTLILLLAVCAAFTTLSATPHLMPKPKVISETRALGKFNKINVGSVYDVEYTYATEVSCVISGKEDFVKRTKLTIKDGVLFIDLECSANNNDCGTLKITLAGPEFHGADISGVVEFKLIGEFPKAPVELIISGASEFKGKINATTFEGNFSGTAEVVLSGQTPKANMNVCGTVELKADDFTADDLYINLSGTASAKISVVNKLKAQTSGVSSLVYIGSPSQVDQTIDGLSTISRI
ncbi:MAG: GIN domain-containing protein [Bacteroidia bacterium]